MANEITISAVSGLSPTAQLYNGTSAVGSSISFAEIGSTGVYVGSVPANTPYGQYSIIAMAGTSTLASGQLFWDGDYEMPIGIGMLQGLDPNNPMTVTPSTRDTGEISLGISGDGVNETTVTRE